jgi:tetratricopeptide (TPR) repeat protein
VPSRWQVAALLNSHRGDHDAAERFARAAQEFADQTDSPKFQADAYCDLAEVFEAAGRRDEAIAAWGEALERYDRKGVVPLARRIRERLAALEPV